MAHEQLRRVGELRRQAELQHMERERREEERREEERREEEAARQRKLKEDEQGDDARDGEEGGGDSLLHVTLALLQEETQEALCEVRETLGQEDEIALGVCEARAQAAPRRRHDCW